MDSKYLENIEKAYWMAYDRCIAEGFEPYGVVHAHWYACIMDDLEKDRNL